MKYGTIKAINFQGLNIIPPLIRYILLWGNPKIQYYETLRFSIMKP